MRFKLAGKSRMIEQRGRRQTRAQFRPQPLATRRIVREFDCDTHVLRFVERDELIETRAMK